VGHLVHQRVDVAEELREREQPGQHRGNQDEQRHFHPGLHARPSFQAEE